MAQNSYALFDFAQQRFTMFYEQNTEKGRFDVTFQFKDKQLYAHSFILWPLSKVFERNLFDELAEKGPIPPERYTYENFKEFLTFLYLGKCSICAENVMELVDLAEYYDIKQLKNQCDAFLTANSPKIDNVLSLYDSLKTYTLKNAMAKVMEIVAFNTEVVFKSDDFLNAEKETIVDIVKVDNLTSKEEELFKAVLNWAVNKNGNNNEKVKNELADVLPFIRFPVMDLDFLHTFVVHNSFVFPSFEDLSGILRDATNFSKNESSAQRHSKYCNHMRGVRFYFLDDKGNNAYTTLNDTELIKALQDGISNYCNEKGTNVAQLCEIKIDLIEIKNKILKPSPNVAAYLIRRGGDRLNIKIEKDIFFNGNNFHNYEIIAPVVYENETFNPNDSFDIKIK